jgi:cysteine-S-conjugate beta-lyase
MTGSPLDALTLPQLRERNSEKWRSYPPDVLPLFVAEMDVPLAEPIRAVLHEAVDRGDTGYAMPGDLPESYAAFSTERFGWGPAPDAAIVVPDVMQGIVSVLEASTNRGSEVIINPPVYPPFFSFLRNAGRVVRSCPLALDGDTWRLDLDRLAIELSRPQVSAFLLCNPQNPTGAVYRRDELAVISDLAAAHDVRLLVDEIHAPLTYHGVRHVPILSLCDDVPSARRALAFVSASKAWNLAGLKTALAVAGPAAIDVIERVPPDLRDGVGLFGVLASVAAFRSGLPWLDDLMRGLDANRRLLADLIGSEMPDVTWRAPDATYLAWLDCRRLALPYEPSRVFLDRGRVALAEGLRFGEAGRGFVRLNLATHPSILTEAVRRMADALHDQ